LSSSSISHFRGRTSAHEEQSCRQSSPSTFGSVWAKSEDASFSVRNLPDSCRFADEPLGVRKVLVLASRDCILARRGTKMQVSCQSQGGQELIGGMWMLRKESFRSLDAATPILCRRLCSHRRGLARCYDGAESITLDRSTGARLPQQRNSISKKDGSKEGRLWT